MIRTAAARPTSLTPDRDALPTTKRLAKKVLLIGWDAADWEHIHPLLEAGLLPTLDGLIKEGVMGNLATLKPVLSPMLWNTVATGKLADQHGIHGFVEPDPNSGGVRPCASTSRKVKALWNMLSQCGLRSNVVGWWASHPAEPINGVVVSNYFTSSTVTQAGKFKPVPGTIHPAEKEDYLAQFRVLPNELTHEHILPFIPKAAQIDQENDERLQNFGKVLTDCASIHAVATTIMEEEDWDFTAIYYDAIDHFCHAFMPYHPPRLPAVNDDDFELYREVITGAYRFHDMMLARLLQLAGPDTTVILCSDHGFASGQQRPRGVSLDPAGPAEWHRDFGMLVMKGPGIKRDELVYGASLVDLAPTVLSLFGLPVGADMEGRPLVEAFEEPVPFETIPTWEDVPGDAGMHPAGEDGSERNHTDHADELVQQFVALGYVQDPRTDKGQAAANARVELDYNLAQNYLFKRKPDESLRILTRLLAERPWESRFILMLARSYLAAGYHAQAELLLRTAFPAEDALPPSVRLLLGQSFLARNQQSAALEMLLPALELSARNAAVHCQLGDTFLKLRLNEEALAAFQKALEIHPEFALARQGLSTVYLRRREFELAAEAALDAVGLVYRLPVAHYNLGIAMAKLGDMERAVTAFETVLTVRKGHLNAHRWLAALYERLGRDREAEKCRLTAQGLMAKTAASRPQRNERSNQLLGLPSIPSPEERLKITLERRRVRPHVEKPSGKTFVIVSGLPRSGTSLMMQILRSAGMDVRTDGCRAADVDNPEGYYEWEAIKEIGHRPELLDEEGLDEKALKVISMLLPSLPRHHHYKVVFMTRPCEQIVASQRKMVQRLGTDGARLSDDELRQRLESHRAEIFAWLDRADNFDVLTIDYPQLVSDPQAVVHPLVTFLGHDKITDPANITATIRPELHRQQS